MLAEKTNILYAGDVFLTLNKGVELPSLLTAFGLLACLLGLIQIEKACRLDETCTEILQRIVRRYVSANVATVGPGRGGIICVNLVLGSLTGQHVMCWVVIGY